MAPVATTEQTLQSNGTPKKAVSNGIAKVFNPFYSPPASDENDGTYKFAHYKPSFPDIVWAPLEEQEVTDRGLSADPEKNALFSAATKVQHLTPAIGTEITGIDLRQLSPQQKDEFAFSKIELWHSDVSYELQPPSTTSLKLIEGPPYGGDTLWSSGYALFSSFSPQFQKYLESLYAVHSAVAQADGARAAGHTVRREAIESIHPVVRVHPATGWKSVYVNPGFTRRIVGVPKAESDAVLNLLFHQISDNPDFQVRFHWEPNSVAIWDNRVTTHSATFDFYPHTRHALRATPHGEKPTSVEEYERHGKVAKDRQLDIWKQTGISLPESAQLGKSTPRGYND
ncbi:hypothetical protein EW026_g3901 [Hermanssonia centrifuga]|uniref:TauD/TfdA-like domain-containing protein n=1 Tax=Hermanssonia centrifuga TaxID=98765 RepID=A0A4S4KK12_9APHY|nr:hypothetical protein EW026_g3901 [Hermanssonia centrifuga]